MRLKRRADLGRIFYRSEGAFQARIRGLKLVLTEQIGLKLGASAIEFTKSHQVGEEPQAKGLRKQFGRGLARLKEFCR